MKYYTSQCTADKLPSPLSKPDYIISVPADVKDLNLVGYLI